MAFKISYLEDKQDARFPSLFVCGPRDEIYYGFAVDATLRGDRLLMLLADRFQDGFIDLPGIYGSAHPECPGHHHAAEPRLIDDRAWWACPETGTPIERIGRYR